MSKAGRVTRRHRSVGPVDPKPGWKLHRDFYLSRWSIIKEK
jgi:hypothetical protein